jgi:hypothetical protein
MNMEVWALVLLFGILVEAIVQVAKSWVPETAEVPGWLWPVASAVIAILMCITAGVDALTALGVEITVPFIGKAVTGIFVSRGSNFLHDLWSRVKPSEDPRVD